MGRGPFLDADAVGAFASAASDVGALASSAGAFGAAAEVGGAGGAGGDISPVAAAAAPDAMPPSAAALGEFGEGRVSSRQHGFFALVAYLELCFVSN